MDHIYRENISLRASDCDMLGSWRPGAILECMQETAGAHSALLGLDRKTMDGMGVCWVLSRVKVQFSRVPRAYEQVYVETYPLPQRHLFFPRVHIFRDEAGSELGSACALWLLMDVESRRVTGNSTVSEKLPRIQGLHNPVGTPGTVSMMDGDAEESVVIPRFTDLDLNRHVNNTRYLNWCQDALGTKRMMEQEIVSFQVNYDAEVLPGTQVHTKLMCGEKGFVFAGFDEGRQLFAVDGTLRTRNE